MLLLLPLILAAWIFYKKNPHMIPVIFTGLITAVLVCGFRAFFLYAHRVIPFSFGLNMWYLLLRQTLHPIIAFRSILFSVCLPSISSASDIPTPALRIETIWRQKTDISRGLGLAVPNPIETDFVIAVASLSSIGVKPLALILSKAAAITPGTTGTRSPLKSNWGRTHQY